MAKLTLKKIAEAAAEQFNINADVTIRRSRKGQWTLKIYDDEGQVLERYIVVVGATTGKIGFVNADTDEFVE